MRSNTPLDLALVVTTHNSMRTIARCLDSVAGLAASVHVVDSGSTDGTVELCRRMGAEVTHHPWQGYAAQKEFALALPRSEAWVLLLDSDESLEPDLRQGLRDAIERATPQTRGIEINRMMWYEGGWVRHVGFPDWVVRCGRRGALRMVHKPVHERVEADGAVVRAAGICRHESWDGVCDALERAATYARLSAQVRRPARFPVLYSLGSAAAIVLKHGVLRGGFLDGWRGAVALVMYAVGRFANTMATFERSKKNR